MNLAGFERMVDFSKSSLSERGNPRGAKRQNGDGEAV